jgi:hypothetical protein
MKQISIFLKDFIGTFVNFMFIFLVGLTQIISYVLETIVNLVQDIVIPNLLNLFLDLSYISLIVYQGIVSSTSNVCLMLSKFFLVVSQSTHEKSEELIRKHWIT